MTSYTYTALSRSSFSGVNDLDQMVGTDDGGGFLYSNGVYTQINDPLSANGVSSAIGIVITWVRSLARTKPVPAIQQMALFLMASSDSNGVYTTIDDPLGTFGTTTTMMT